VAPGPAPTLKLTAPKGGEKWQLGSKQKITWNCPGYKNQLRIKLFRGFSDWGIIAKPDATAGFYEWKVGDMLPPDNHHTFVAGADYRVYIETLNGELHDQSAKAFSITVPLSLQIDPNKVKSAADAMAEKWIKVLSPVAGANLKRIEQYDLLWQCSDFMKKQWAKVWLLKNGAPFQVLTERMYLNSGHNYFQLLTDVPAGDYQIRIEGRDWPNVKGDSGVFHLIETVKSLNLTYDAQARNVYKYHHVWPSGAFTTQCEGHEWKDPGPKSARVGYHNIKIGDDDWCHFIYRSHVFFDIKGLTGEAQSAKITFSETSAPPTIFKVFVLTAAWDGQADALFSIPCKVLMLNDPNQLRDVVSNWVKNSGQNYGLVIVGDNESQSGSGSAIHILNNIKLEMTEKVTE
jgi:hypothetical protein